MLGVKGRWNPDRQMSSTRVALKRGRAASGVFDASSPDSLPGKRTRSTGDDFEGHSATFTAKCFYSPKGRGKYQTPLQRQVRREQLGEVLPSKPPVETDKKTKKTRKIPAYRSVNASNTRKSTRRTQRMKAVPKDKPINSNETGSRDRSQSRSLTDSTSSTKSSPNKIKTSKRRSPSKRTPRKSPRKGVKKAVKLYIQGMKKNPKASSKPTTKGMRVSKQNIGQKNTTGLAAENKPKQQTQPKRASKKLDVDFEDVANQKGDEEMMETDNDQSVISPSPKPATKKRSMRLKEDIETFVPKEKVRQSPRRSLRTPLVGEHGDGTTEQVLTAEDILKGFEPKTPDSLASQIAEKVSPKKAVATVPVFMTPPISPTSNKKPASATHSPATSTPIQQRKLSVMKKMTDNDAMEQMTMDLGQKRFGATSCEMCGMVYTAAHPEDEASHDKFHRKYLSSVKFPGWKNERLLLEFEDGRVIMVLHDDPKYHIKKVEEIRHLVDQELGFQQGGDVACKTTSKVFLFITTEKKVGGCLIAEEISKGYRVITDSDMIPSSSEEQKLFEQQRAWCCETNPEPAVCGVSRVWVASQERRKQIATKLLDCLRNFFMFGSVLPKESIAFSDPTPDGKMFATAYMKTPRFLVYKYH